MQAELDRFIAEWKTKSSANTVELAYELTYKEDILTSFNFDLVGSVPLSDEQAQALLSLKKPLDYLYQEWLEYDGNVLDKLRESNDQAIDKAIEHKKSRSQKEQKDLGD